MSHHHHRWSCQMAFDRLVGYRVPNSKVPNRHYLKFLVTFNSADSLKSSADVVSVHRALVTLRTYRFEHQLVRRELKYTLSFCLNLIRFCNSEIKNEPKMGKHLFIYSIEKILEHHILNLRFRNFFFYFFSRNFL